MITACEKNSANMSVQTIAQTNPTEWAISDAIKNKYNSSEFHIFHKNTKVHPRVQLATPMRCPFGVSQFNDQGTLTINFSIGQSHEDVKLFLKALDNLILDWCWDNRQSVFANKVPASREVFESMYNTVLIPGKNGLDELLRCKISQSCPVWLVTENGATKSGIENVEPQCQCVPVLSFDKVWAMAGRFGVTVRVQALLCYPRKEQKLEELFPSFDAFSAST
jgi:hypothetical protein